MNSQYIFKKVSLVKSIFYLILFIYLDIKFFVNFANCNNEYFLIIYFIGFFCQIILIFYFSASKVKAYLREDSIQCGDFSEKYYNIKGYSIKNGLLVDSFTLICLNETYILYVFNFGRSKRNFQLFISSFNDLIKENNFNVIENLDLSQTKKNNYISANIFLYILISLNLFYFILVTCYNITYNWKIISFNVFGLLIYFHKLESRKDKN